MNLEDLKNVQVNLDSATAQQIADQYIRYKYIDSAMGFICVMTMLLGCAFIVYLVFRLFRGGKGSERVGSGAQGT